MPYRITYTVDTVGHIPEGATVERISALPLDIDRFAEPSIRFFHLDASAHDNDVAFFSIGGEGKHLTREQTTQVRDALNELLGEAPNTLNWDGHREPPVGIAHTVDREGDDWYRLHNGNWSIDKYAEHGRPWNVGAADYTPHRLP